jgi:drug/metabolite transporter (DMT)-like permease
MVGAAGRGSRSGSSGLCSGIKRQTSCVMHDGCSWCVSRETERLAASGAQGTARPGAERCVAWSECTWPSSLCDVQENKTSCAATGKKPGSCVWCGSQSRCVSASLTAGEGAPSGRWLNESLPTGAQGQCVGCNGVFDGKACRSTKGGMLDFYFTREERIGIYLALAGNVLISVALNLQKYAHNVNVAESGGKRAYTSLPYWWLGMIVMAAGETGNFVAYAYAPATVVAPLGAVSVISNCLLAHYVLKERLCVRNLLGVALAIIGAVIIVTYAPSSDRQLTMDVLVSYMSETGFLVFVAVICSGIVGLYCLSDAIKKRYVVVYTLICSLTGALTVMCIKGVSTALVLTLQGQNQFNQVLPWAMIAVVVFTLIMQLRYLNLAMMHFGASEVVPVYYVLFTFCSIVAGLVLFKEYHQHCPPENPACLNTIFFLAGCAVTFSGVYMITLAGKKAVGVYDEAADLALGAIDIETEGLLGGELELTDVKIRDH